VGDVADFDLLDVAVQRGALVGLVEHDLEIADATGGEGLDGTGRDCVDADVLAADRGGEVADSGFQTSLGDAHDVVVGERDLGAEVGEGDDGTAFSHKRYSGVGDGDQRVDADVQGEGEVSALGEEEVVVHGRGGREGYGVDEGVDDREGGGDLCERGFDLLVRGNVHLDGAGLAGLAEGLDELFGLFLQALGLVAEDERGSGGGELFGDGIGDAAFVGNAENDGDFALHVDHDAVTPLGKLTEGKDSSLAGVR